MTHPFNDPVMLLLKEASNAAHTPERQALLEGLLEGQDRLIQQTLEQAEHHDQLFADDFFWCFMGLAAHVGDRSFWRVIRDWGYSLESEIHFPDPNDPSPAWSGRKGTRLGTWALQTLPLEQVQWLVKNGLMDLWKHNSEYPLNMGEAGMLVCPNDVFDWLAGQWGEHGASMPKTSPKKRVPTVLFSLHGFIEKNERTKDLKQLKTPEELQRRYDALARSYLAWSVPGAQSLKEQVQGFMANPPPESHVSESGLANWMWGQCPQAFEGHWFTACLENSGWRWAKEAWKAGAPGPAMEEEPKGSQRLFQLVLDGEPQSDDKALEALEVWLESLPSNQVKDFVEGNEPLTRAWEAFEKGKLTATQWLVERGADLDQKHPVTGEKLGSHILRAALSSSGGEWASTKHSRDLLWNAVAQMPSHQGKLRQWWDADTMVGPVFQLCQGKKWNQLSRFINQGLPLDIVDEEDGMGIGWKLLAHAHQGTLEKKVWEAYVRRASEDANAPPATILNMDGDSVVTGLKGNTKLGLALKKRALDHRLPKTSLTQPRPRF